MTRHIRTLRERITIGLIPPLFVGLVVLIAWLLSQWFK